MSAETPRERPILFNDQMVRAILEGRKTVTRRVMKPQPTPSKDGGHHWPCNVHQSMLHVERELQNGEGCWCGLAEAACPFGQPGERLWVREAWTIDLLAAYSTEKGYDSEYELRYRTDDASREIHVAPGEPDPYLALYDSQRGDWRPSIHMPRWASRILLEITAVRIERLQDISDDQAIAEGIDTHPTGFYGNGCITAGGAFLELWESINGDGKWAANPWVWVVEFKRVTP
ncbi:hypothetical protein PZT66_31340 [Pseudomonas aeruginosa]|mgnify:CR=1 FL=1|uniref:hypothetical protein n=2 Tax=Pseudomonas aeruginosa TaxID=287 RepID=UPI00053D210C|nr:hypothetical protein [Pseudomonas aeruginosa]EKJ8515397.1 hypothetical protein [Pseudomonas aeruginosa]EKV3152013.1 hypothetical protein [Pseudomonas aeruginosa]EKV9029082.1 hypothetical protein [Pseudomonas aeruginosa]ELK7306484.1 hypothetical protein [Pseudomonas aeruginosa]ELL4431411.1 hypothetical protein [Pseudomonas aeruginosa]